MSISPITHILQIARMLRDEVTRAGGPGNGSVVSALSTQKGISEDSPEFYRILSEFQRQIADAQSVIENDERMDAEGRNGLVQQLGQLRAMFRVGALNGAISNHVPNGDVLVSQFAIIAGFYSSTPKPYESAQPELSELAAEIDQLDGMISSSNQPVEVVELMRGQLRALKFFLLNVDMLGFDAAYSAYFDFVIRLRRVEKKNESSAEFVAKIWPSVERWAGRLAIIEGLASNSEKLIGTVDQLHKLLT